MRVNTECFKVSKEGKVIFDSKGLGRFSRKRDILDGVCSVLRNLTQSSVWEGILGRKNSVDKSTEAGRLGVLRTVVWQCPVWVSKPERAGQMGREHVVGNTCMQLRV